MARKNITEIFFLRAIACMAVVMIHSMTAAVYLYDLLGTQAGDYIRTTQTLLMFGTPMFVFISEFVLSYSYPDDLPSKFWGKRIKFILLPYISMGIFYGLFDYYNSPSMSLVEVSSTIWWNIVIGDFHGYFILIVFQFYFLHWAFARFLKNRIPVLAVMAGSFIISALYLGYFNFVPVWGSHPFVHWMHAHFKLLFPGWVFYFTIAYYCGKNYEAFITFLRKNIAWIAAVLLLSMSSVLYMRWTGWLTPTYSTRIDILLYTVSLGLILFFIASKFKRTPKTIQWISQYSFGIYLLHPVIQTVIRPHIYLEYSQANAILFIALNFVIPMVGSILITWTLNRVKFGDMIVGRVKPKKAPAPSLKKQEPLPDKAV